MVKMVVVVVVVVVVLMAVGIERSCAICVEVGGSRKVVHLEGKV